MVGGGNWIEHWIWVFICYLSITFQQKMQNKMFQGHE